MKYLFIGNSYTWCSMHLMPHILNKCDNHNIEITIIYICGANPHNFIDGFETSMSKKLGNDIRTVPSNNVIYTYVYGDNKYKMEKMPDKSIKDIIKNNYYDKVIINICNTYYHYAWHYNFMEKYFKNFFSLLRKYYNGEIFYIEEPVISPISDANPKSKKYFYGGTDALCKTKLDMYSNMNYAINKLSKELNFKIIRIRINYLNLQNSSMRNECDLLTDGRHPDEGIGKYMCSAVVYYKLFYNTTKTKLSNINFTYSPNSSYVLNKNILSLPVNQENKKIVDNIVEKFYSHLFKNNK